MTKRTKTARGRGSNSAPSNLALGYVRVSTEDQRDCGYSLQAQEEKIEAYCIHRGIQLVKTFKDSKSGKSFKRQGFEDALGYIKEHKGQIGFFVVTRWDRFGRNQLESLKMMALLRNLGVSVTSVEMPIRDDVPEDLILLSLYTGIAEADNLRRSLNVRLGMRQAAKEGRWMHRAPKGYDTAHFDNGKTKTIIPNKDAPHLSDAFRSILAGAGQEETRRRLSAAGLVCSTNRFNKILRSVVYAGYVTVPGYQGEPETIVRGQHQALISKEEFDRVQDILDGRARHREMPSRKREDFPLHGFLVCPRCELKLTSSYSKGNGGHYAYYHCRRGCKERNRLADVHDAFSRFLRSHRPQEGIKRLYRLALRRTVEMQGAERRLSERQIRAEISEKQHMVQKIDSNYAKGEIPAESYNRIIAQLTRDLVELRERLEALETDHRALYDQIETGLTILDRLEEVFWHVPIATQRRILGSIFPEKLRFENGEVRTNGNNLFLNFFSSIFNDLDGQTQKTPAISGERSRLVLPTGFEPVFSP